MTMGRESSLSDGNVAFSSPCPQSKHKVSLHFPCPSMLLALYQHCCPAVRVWLSIRRLPALLSHRLDGGGGGGGGGRERRQKKMKGKRLEGSQVYTSCC